MSICIALSAAWERQAKYRRCPPGKTSEDAPGGACSTNCATATGQDKDSIVSRGRLYALCVQIFGVNIGCAVSGRQPGTGKPGNCPPPEIFANMMASTYIALKIFSRDCVISTWTSSPDNVFVCERAASCEYRIKLLTNQCTMLPKTPNTEALRR